MLLSNLLELYRVRNLRAKPATLGQYGYTVGLFSRHLSRPAQEKDLIQDLVTSFLRDRLDEGTAAATVNTNRAHLLLLASFAFDEGRLSRPLRRVFRATEPKRIPDSWMPEQVGRIVAACEQEPDDCGFTAAHWKALVLCYYYTCGRKGVILNALRGDVQDGCFILRAENQKRNNEQRPNLPQHVLDAVAALPETERMFPWPYSVETFDKRYGAILERAGLPNGRRDKIQKLRRSGLTEVALAYSIDAASTLAGHSDRKLTINNYIDGRRIQLDTSARMPVVGANG